MHPSAGYWSLCRGIWELLLQYSQYSVWREAESEGTWRARLRVGTRPSVCTGVIIRLGGNNIRIVYATHTTNIKKRHCLYSEKNITAAMIHHLSSGHMFSWSPDLVEINWPIRSVWDSSLCKHWEKKKYMHSRHMGRTELFGHDASAVFITLYISFLNRNSVKMSNASKISCP